MQTWVRNYLSTRAPIVYFAFFKYPYYLSNEKVGNDVCSLLASDSQSYRVTESQTPKSRDSGNDFFVPQFSDGSVTFPGTRKRNKNIRDFINFLTSQDCCSSTIIKCILIDLCLICRLNIIYHCNFLIIKALLKRSKYIHTYIHHHEITTNDLVYDRMKQFVQHSLQKRKPPPTVKIHLVLYIFMCFED